MTPHLRGQVRAYVDRGLPAPVLREFDQHVVVCVSCRAAADQERRIVTSLRADTGVPQALRSSLLGLASLTTAAARAPLAGSRALGGPDVPVPPVGFRMPLSSVRESVPTVPPRSPALHRSPMRAAVVASLAAGASVAAAWSLAVTPLPTSMVSRTPVSRVPVGVTSVGGSVLPPAGFVARSDEVQQAVRTPSNAVSQVVVQLRSIGGATGAASGTGGAVMSVTVSDPLAPRPVRRAVLSSAQLGP